jgi:hypothetical protein
VVSFLDCFQTRGREAAGDGPWQSGASVDGVVVVLGLPKSKQVEECECAEEGERGKQRGVMEWPKFTGIWSFELPAMVEIGEKFLQPGGVSDGGNRGERERRCRAFIGIGESDESGGQSIELKRRIYGEETVSGINSVQGRRT